MDRFQEAMGELARRTVEAQLLAAEASIAELVRREVAELAAVVSREVATLASTRPDAEDPLAAAAAAARAAANPELATMASGRRPGVPASCASAALAFGRRPAGTLRSEDAKQTIWEAVVLFGLPVLGRAGSAILLLNFISSVSLQVLVCYILGGGLLRDPITGGSIVRQWEALKAQQLLNQTVAAAALAEAGGGAGDAPGSAAALPKAVASGPATPEIMPVMCTMILLLWILSVTHEFHCAFGSAKAVWALPRGTTQFIRSGGISVLVSISPPRLYMLVAAATVRLALAGALLVMGSRTLAGAKSTTELWMSAAALGFALDMPRRTAAWGVIARR